GEDGVRIVRYGTAAWRRYREGLPRTSTPRPATERAVASILRAVRRDGDAALVRLSARFDGVRLRAGELRVPAERIRALARRADPPGGDAAADARIQPGGRGRARAGGAGGRGVPRRRRASGGGLRVRHRDRPRGVEDRRPRQRVRRRRQAPGAGNGRDRPGGG